MPITAADLSIGLAQELRLDAHDVTVTPQYVVEVSHRVRDDFNDGENYLRRHGERIVVPEREGWRPDRAALAWHNERRYRG